MPASAPVHVQCSLRPVTVCNAQCTTSLHQGNSFTPLLQAVHQQQAAAEQERRVPAGKGAQEADADKASETGRAAASYVPPKWAGVPEGWVSPSC